MGIYDRSIDRSIDFDESGAFAVTAAGRQVQFDFFFRQWNVALRRVWCVSPLVGLSSRLTGAGCLPLVRSRQVKMSTLLAVALADVGEEQDEDADAQAEENKHIKRVARHQLVPPRLDHHRGTLRCRLLGKR